MFFLFNCAKLRSPLCINFVLNLCIRIKPWVKIPNFLKSCRQNVTDKKSPGFFSLKNILFMNKRSLELRTIFSTGLLQSQNLGLYFRTLVLLRSFRAGYHCNSFSLRTVMINLFVYTKNKFHMWL